MWNLPLFKNGETLTHDGHVAFIEVAKGPRGRFAGESAFRQQHRWLQLPSKVTIPENRPENRRPQEIPRCSRWNTLNLDGPDRWDRVGPSSGTSVRACIPSITAGTRRAIDPGTHMIAPAAD
jgi:hypothetical protein